MLETLKFIQGAVAKKDFVPVLTHVNICDGVIQAYNGRIMLSSPIELNLNCSPKADKFIKAIQTCKDTIQMSITPTGRLSVKSKGFKTLVECSSDPFPNAKLAGEYVEMPGEGFIEALKKLEPFIAEDDSRKWARGILFKDRTANATNNITMVQLWLNWAFPMPINLPHAAVTELIRIKQEPVAMMIDETQVTFLYENDRWLRSQLYTTQWPNVDPIYAKAGKLASPIPEGFFEALKDVQPFVDPLRRVYLMSGKVATAPDVEVASSSEVEGLDAWGNVYNVDQLIALEKVAVSINFRPAEGAPMLFYGDGLRGVIMGLRS